MKREPSRTSKRGDTWEPLTGTLYDQDGPADLSGWTLRFLGRTDEDGVIFIIDSNEPDHGECINVYDQDGPGDDIEIAWPLDALPADQEIITVPENKGRYRFEPGDLGVSTAGFFETEIECTRVIETVLKTFTFPSRAKFNPIWRIDEDIRSSV